MNFVVPLSVIMTAMRQLDLSNPEDQKVLTAITKCILYSMSQFQGVDLDKLMNFDSPEDKAHYALNFCDQKPDNFGFNPTLRTIVASTFPSYCPAVGFLSHMCFPARPFPNLIPIVLPFS